MKTNNPNVLFNHQVILLLEKTSEIMKKELLLILVLVSFFSVSNAQNFRVNNENDVIVTDMNSILYTNTSARLANNPAINVQRIRSLVTEVQSSTYFYEGVVKTYGDVPTNLFTDFSSLSQLNNSISLKQNIEIVTIRINTSSELNSTIDLSIFSNFPNLKYIYILSNVQTTKSVIAGLIQNNDERFSIYYKIDKGS